VVLPSGEVRNLLVQGRILYSEGGDPIRVVGAMQEITEFRTLQNEREYHFHVSGDPIAVLGLDGMMLQLSDAWESTVGWSVSELAARPYYLFVRQEEQARTLAALHRLGRGLQSESFEHRFSKKAVGSCGCLGGSRPTYNGELQWGLHEISPSRLSIMKP
jgi:PAS domain-containing protein